jgi:hypothetical protein
VQPASLELQPDCRTPSDQTSDTRSARVAPPRPTAVGCRLWPPPDCARTVSKAVQREPVRTATFVPMPETFERR